MSGKGRRSPLNFSRSRLISSRIRFAAPPTGSNRWQAPQVPAMSRDNVIEANSYAPICVQNQNTGLAFVPLNSTGSSEDCLFLNVYAPANISEPLPVLVWIHGGGYGRGNGRQDLSALINANNDSFVGVSIQYRVCHTDSQADVILITSSSAHSGFSLVTKSSGKVL